MMSALLGGRLLALSGLAMCATAHPAFKTRSARRLHSDEQRTLTVGSRLPPGRRFSRTTSSRVAGCSCEGDERASWGEWPLLGPAGALCTTHPAPGSSQSQPRKQTVCALHDTKGRNQAFTPESMTIQRASSPARKSQEHRYKISNRFSLASETSKIYPHPGVHDDPARQLARAADLLAC